MTFYKKINLFIDPKVFWFSNFTIFSILAFGFTTEDSFLGTIKNLKINLLNNFGWFFILSIIGLIYFMIKAFVKFGDYKIGGPNAEIEFSNLAWIAMLFSAGLGIGLIYSGIYEPMYQFYHAPQIQHLKESQKFLASLNLSFFHWGIPAWIVYSATGFIFAHTGHTLKKGFQFSYYCPQKWGLPVIINTLCIVLILLGVVIGLTLGAQQINAGLQFVFKGFSINASNQVWIISLITFVAAFSVVSGINKGIKFLSIANIFLAASFLIYIFFHNSISEQINLFIQTFGFHTSHFFQSLTYTAVKSDKSWLNNWSILYWAWWASWAPFVGLFIARISKGRTLKEFILGTVLVPSFICFIWFTVFSLFSYNLISTTSIDFETLISKSPHSTLFASLEYSSFPFIASMIAIICLCVFFVTSSDSGSYVVDMIASGGKTAPHSYLKIYWSIIEGLLAISLLLIGGVSLMRDLTIILSFPVILYLLYATKKCLDSLKEK